MGARGGDVVVSAPGLKNEISTIGKNCAIIKHQPVDSAAHKLFINTIKSICRNCDDLAQQKTIETYVQQRKSR
jgi:hypothetical protein